MNNKEQANQRLQKYLQQSPNLLSPNLSLSWFKPFSNPWSAHLGWLLSRGRLGVNLSNWYSEEDGGWINLHRRAPLVIHNSRQELRIHTNPEIHQIPLVYRQYPSNVREPHNLNNLLPVQKTLLLQLHLVWVRPEYDDAQDLTHFLPDSLITLGWVFAHVLFSFSTTTIKLDRMEKFSRSLDVYQVRVFTYSKVRWPHISFIQTSHW